MSTEFSPAQDVQHLLIDGALAPDANLRPGLPPLPAPAAPQLQALVRRLGTQGRILARDDALATPLELALAQAHALPAQQGQLPWAAFETGTVGQACAWLRPSHWQIGMDQVHVLDPDELALDEAESRALMDTVQGLLREDGLELTYVRSDAWLATGARLQGLRTPSLARALQQPLSPDALQQSPDPKARAWLQRLMGELQMLIYNHPVNDAREQTGRWPVNAIWIDGAGQLDAPHPARPGVHVERRLRSLGPADADLRQQAWQAIDQAFGAPLLAAARAGRPVRLSLCGAGQAITLGPAQGWSQKLATRLRPLDLGKLVQADD